VHKKTIVAKFFFLLILTLPVNTFSTYTFMIDIIIHHPLSEQKTVSYSHMEKQSKASENRLFQFVPAENYYINNLL